MAGIADSNQLACYLVFDVMDPHSDVVDSHGTVLNSYAALPTL